MSDRVSETDAIKALEVRGIDNPERVLSSTTPEQVISSCKWYDQQKDAKPGLLVWRLRANVDVEKTDSETARVDKRTRFQQIADRFPVTAIAESHKRLQRRRDYEEDCDGAMVVIQADYPFLVARCDGCGFEASYPYRALIGGVLPERPSVASRPVPDPKPQVPESQHRPAQPQQVMARLSKHHAIKSTGG